MSEMTPEEACQKWCPNYRVTDKSRKDVDNREGRCLGPECADWEWIKHGNQPPTTGRCGLIHPE